MAKTLLDTVSETFTPPRRRWMPWRRKTLTERVGDVTEQVSGTTSDRAGQIGQSSTALIGQLGQASSDLLEQARARTAGLAQRSGLQSAADLAAERAAFAAEAAALAAQRAAGLMERVGIWVGLPTNRAAQQEPALPTPVAAPIAGRAVTTRRMAAVVTPLARVSPQEAGGGGMTQRLKQMAMNVGERINDWSDGRYGLEPQKPNKKAGRATKKSARQRERVAEKAAKEAAKSSGVSWLPWVIGLSIGLVVGLVGVAYWQRQRLQHLWGETSQRVQQATGNMRQRIEANRSPNPEKLPRDVPPATPNFRPFGSATSVSNADQTTNGRLESTSQ